MRQPLAAILRPTSFDDFVGQEHILGPDKPLRRMIEVDKIHSVIFFGPPGTGKTTVAEIVAKKTQSEFTTLNAKSSGIKDLRVLITKAETRLSLDDKRTIVFIDEIHGWNKSQQDVLLPQVEKGTIILIGATTQNPFFSINGPILSRSELFEFKTLSTGDLKKVIKRVIRYYLEKKEIEIRFKKGVADYLVERSGGDARKLINVMEIGVEIQQSDKVEFTLDLVKMILPRKHVIFDQAGDEHFDGLSALQGSIQASDPHSAVYWLAWLINHGEDIAVINRRLLVTAAEDVSISDPHVLPYVNAACQASERVGFPEAQIILGCAVAYMAMTPRSKAGAMAIWEAMKLDKAASLEVPDWLKDCHYKGAEKLGRGAYHDGANQPVYKPIITDLFKPVTGLEVELMRGNDEYWKKRAPKKSKGST
jgi:putative ATPase